jgi:hypothetical protein
MNLLNSEDYIHMLSLLRKQISDKIHLLLNYQFKPSIMQLINNFNLCSKCNWYDAFQTYTKYDWVCIILLSIFYLTEIWDQLLLLWSTIQIGLLKKIMKSTTKTWSFIRYLNIMMPDIIYIH